MSIDLSYSNIIRSQSFCFFYFLSLIIFFRCWFDVFDVYGVYLLYAYFHKLDFYFYLTDTVDSSWRVFFLIYYGKMSCFLILFPLGCYYFVIIDCFRFCRLYALLLCWAVYWQNFISLHLATYSLAWLVCVLENFLILFRMIWLQLILLSPKNRIFGTQRPKYLPLKTYL